MLNVVTQHTVTPQSHSATVTQGLVVFVGSALLLRQQATKFYTKCLHKLPVSVWHPPAATRSPVPGPAWHDLVISFNCVLCHLATRCSLAACSLIVLATCKLYSHLNRVAEWACRQLLGSNLPNPRYRSSSDFLTGTAAGKNTLLNVVSNKQRYN